LLPKVKAAWRYVAEQTVAGLTSVSSEQVTDVLAALAASLTAGDGAEGDLPRYVTRSNRP
jgi:hypothetical protein